MELVTPLGIVLALTAVAVSFVLEGGNPMVAFSNPGAIVLVVVGTVGVGLASSRTRDVGGVVRAGLRTLLPQRGGPSPEQAVQLLVEHAGTARREGLLALEEVAAGTADPFLRRGLRLVADGVDSDRLAGLLEDDIAAMQARHRVAATFFTHCGAYAPALGIVGTVLGLTLALSHVEDPAEMGHAVSAAFLATLWGIGTANCFWLPMANAMKRRSAAEVEQRRMLLEGLLVLQAGAGPRGVRDAVEGFLPPAARERPAAEAA